MQNTLPRSFLTITTAMPTYISDNASVIILDIASEMVSQEVEETLK